MKKSNAKKGGSGFKIFSWILVLLLVCVAAFLVWEIYKLNVLPSGLLMPALVVLVLIALIVLVLQLGFTKGPASKFLISLITVVAIAVYSVGSFYLVKTNSLFDSISSDSNEVSTTVVVLAMADDDEIKDVDSLNGRTLGVLKSIQTVATEKCLGGIADQGVTVSEKSYDSIPALAQALYDGSVPAIVLTQASLENLKDSAANASEAESEAADENSDAEVQEEAEAATEENSDGSTVDMSQFKTITSDTKVVYSLTYSTTKESTTVAVDDITNTPFTIMITGMDSENGFTEAARSDVNMLVTVNPQTHVILLTSIPRDFYVETACDPSDGCQNGAMDKLTHTGLHGMDTTKKTLEKLFGITINYSVKVNFNTVVKLVDALGGIEVTVEPGLAVDYFTGLEGFSVSEGVNYLNGEQALRYARERNSYVDGDRQRVKNQQQVLEGILNKAMSPAILTNYASLMDALNGTFITDIDTKDIQALIQMQLSKNPSWSILTYSVNGSGATDYCAELGNTAYVMVPDKETVETAAAKINAVIDGKSADEVENTTSSGTASTAKKEEDAEAEAEAAQTDNSGNNEGDDYLYYDPNTGYYYEEPQYYYDANGSLFYYDGAGNIVYV